MDSVKADLDLRFEYAKDGFTRVAVQAAVIAAWVVFASIAGTIGGGVTGAASAVLPPSLLRQGI
jgi:hypothetical protein